MGIERAGLFCAVVLSGALCGMPKADAANAQLQAVSDLSGNIHVRFDAGTGQTRIAGHVDSNLCFSFALPQEWRSTTGGMETRLTSSRSRAELLVNLRSSRELRGLPQPDLTSRDAALLQQDYESLFGRPAQSVSLASLAPGATRWSATWADPYLPSGPMTIEAFIVPLSEDWVLELSFSSMEEKEEYDALVRSLLVNLRALQGSGCLDPMVF
jgi:hypothetical protein